MFWLWTVLASFDLLMTLIPYKQLIKHFFMLLFWDILYYLCMVDPGSCVVGSFTMWHSYQAKIWFGSQEVIFYGYLYLACFKILIPCFYAFEHFPDMRCFRGFDAGLKLELGLDGCFTSSCSPSDTLMHFSECSCLPLRISLKRESLRC